jgi:hypothetical protein
VVLLTPGVARSQSRSERIGDLRITAELHEDGSMDVVEEREFVYDGSFQGAFVEIPMRDGQRAELRSLTDERGTTYTPGSCSPDGDKVPGAYAVESDSGVFRVTWCWDPPPTDTSRTVRLSYHVEGAGQRHADAAELYWQFVGKSWDVPTADVVVDVTLPSDDLRFWVHGPLTGTVEPAGSNAVRLAVEDLPPNTFVELRVLMPPEALAAAPSDGEEVRDDILAEEQCLAAAANADRARARGEEPAEDCDPAAGRKLALTGLLGVGLLGGGLGWWQVFRRHGREYPLPEGLPDYEHEPPSDHPPAFVDYLLHWGSVTEQALIATIMDLARRRHLVLRREMVSRERLLRGDVEEPVMVFERGPEPARSWERDVMHLLFDLADSDGRSITDSALKSWVAANREDAYRWWQSWTSAVTRDTAGVRWIEPKHWTGVSAAIGVGVLATGVGAAILGANIVLGVVAGVVRCPPSVPCPPWSWPTRGTTRPALAREESPSRTGRRQVQPRQTVRRARV